ncbi:MAG: peptidoglycan editing factor PgeF [Thermosynechococcaceae cyanobacterium]
MHTWSWQTWQGSTYLTCSLLDRWPHGYFTRQTWPQTPQALVSAVHPEAEVFRVKQVHGNQILSSTEVQSHLAQQHPTDSNSELTFPEADGLISDSDRQSMWVCSADCTPVLIADDRTGQVAAVHAGWRGTAAKIVPAAIARLQAQGSRIEDLRVAMGPAIAGDVYQVTAEVAAKVGQSLLDPETVDLTDTQTAIQTIVQTLMDWPQPPILADAKAGHLRLDVRRINALQLEQLGLDPTHIAIAPHCTYQDPDRFFSYRRDGRRQVQWSGIVSTSPVQP